MITTLVASSYPLKHLAIIPDGNRRWAKVRGLRPEAGHRHGFLNVTPSLLEAACNEFHIQEVTLWLFSYDNWQRCSDEVEPLMDIYAELLGLLRDMTLTKDLKVSHLGRKDRIPADLRQALDKQEEMPCSPDAFRLNLGLDYGGRAGIMDALKFLSGLDDAAIPCAIDEQLRAAPDLILRTSGERRLSGFTPLHCSISELHFVDTLYPDMTASLLKGIVDDYYVREQKRGC